MTDERLQVWYRVAGVSKFSKLWGIVREEIPKGNYQMRISNSTTVIHIDFDYAKFGVKRSFKLQSKSHLGGAGAVPAAVFWVAFIFCVFASLVSLIRMRKESKLKNA